MSTRQWRKVRAAVLQRDGYRCTIGISPRCTGTADCVDHILERANGGSDHPANLRASCTPCNGFRSAQQTHEALQSRIAPTVPASAHEGDGPRDVVLIVGPPGAGKSTLAAHLASLGYAWLEREQYRTHADYRVAAAGARTMHRAAIVRTCPTLAEQQQWVDLTAATRVIVLDIDPDEAARRIARRKRSRWRGEVAAARAWRTTRGTHQTPSDTYADW